MGAFAKCRGSYFYGPWEIRGTDYFYVGYFSQGELYFEVTDLKELYGNIVTFNLG